MNGLAAVLLLLNGVALLLVPRRWAPLPLLVGTCYIPSYLSLELGLFHFTAIRMLIAIGVVRMIALHEFPVGRMNGLDRAMLVWGIWLLISGAFHEPPSSALVFRLGLLYDTFGIYALVRGYCRSVDDVLSMCRMTAIVLVPLAAAMLYEKLAVQNLFFILGGGEIPLIREGKVRANGPFAHAILAGTVGAICLPLMIGLWRTQRKRAVVGTIACLAIVYASASSGPILSAVAGIFALCLWHYRARIRTFQWLAVAVYIVLDLIMKDPAYFLIARVDLAGGSTSWYRARLIQSAFERLPEWWLTGTDFTHDWMQAFLAGSPNHTDITSHYIQMGVWGGLPLMFLFIAVLMKGFSGVTQAGRQQSKQPSGSAFLLWTLGSSLFALAITGLSVSYFDQSFVFLYLVLGAIGSAWSAAVSAQRGKATNIPHATKMSNKRIMMHH
jgi:hypothetical protein